MHLSYYLRPSAVKPATHALLFLHGLGDEGASWSSFFEPLQEGGLPGTGTDRLLGLYPDAPVQPVTLNGGMRMPSWYDIYGLTTGTREDEAGLKRASRHVLDSLSFLEKEHGIPSSRVILGGTTLCAGASSPVTHVVHTPTIRILAGRRC
jgi:predicted esterase